MKEQEIRTLKRCNMGPIFQPSNSVAVTYTTKIDGPCYLILTTAFDSLLSEHRSSYCILVGLSVLSTLLSCVLEFVSIVNKLIYFFFVLIVSLDFLFPHHPLQSHQINNPNMSATKGNNSNGFVIQ